MSDRKRTRAKLLEMRAQIDEMLSETAGSTPPSPPVVERTWVRISEFARTHGYAAKTVSQWCKLGMPHIGTGHHCRIDVRAAERWIADDGPRKAAMRLGMIAHAKEVG